MYLNIHRRIGNVDQDLQGRSHWLLSGSTPASNKEPESGEDQIVAVCSGVYDALKLELRPYITDELRTIREGQDFTYSKILDASHTVLGHVRCLEENPVPNSDDVAVFREYVSTL